MTELTKRKNRELVALLRQVENPHLVAFVPYIPHSMRFDYEFDKDGLIVPKKRK